MSEEKECPTVRDPVEAVVSWIKCDSWEDLPVGTWLTKIDKERKPYNVAEVGKNSQGDKIIIVGNHFSFDMGNIIAYAKFNFLDSN